MTTPTIPPREAADEPRRPAAARPPQVADSEFVLGRSALWEPAHSAVEPSAHPEIPATAPEAASGGLSRPREASSCDCVTPWDPPAPVLLIATGKDGPVRRSHPLPKVADVRAAADEALSVLGCRRVKPWRDGRHVLLPPQPGARGKTRPCWHAQLDDGTLAVLDTPDETGSGVHCPDCHRDFHNAGAWGMHRARGRYGLGECKDPATVKCIRFTEVTPGRVDLIGRPVAASRLERVTYGAPMLKRTAGGVWSVDPLAPWGVGGPRMTREEASTIWTRAQERLGGARCPACFKARRTGSRAAVGHTESGPWEFGCGHNRERQHDA